MSQLGSTKPFVVFLLGTLSCAGCRPGSEPSESRTSRSGPLLTVDTIVARRVESLTREQSFTGLVKARQSGDLAFTQSGRVARVLVEAGSTVKSGQPIAELDVQRLKLKKKHLEDALKLARDSQPDDVSDAAETTTEQVRESIRRLRTELDQLETELFARPRQPADAELPTRSFGERMNQVELRVAALNRTARREQVRLIADLEGQIEDLDRQLAEGTLTAPFDGIVTLQYVSTGAVVSAGMPIVRFVQHDALDIWVGMPREIVEELSEDLEVVVRDNGQDHTARLHAKLPELDETTRTRVVVLRPIPEHSASMVAGDIVQVRLQWPDRVAGFWLPISSLHRPDQGPWSIYVIEGLPGSQVVARRNIEIVYQRDGQVFARGNLVDGELVIADGMHRIVPRQRVISRTVAGDQPSAAGIEPAS